MHEDVLFNGCSRMEFERLSGDLGWYVGMAEGCSYLNVGKSKRYYAGHILLNLKRSSGLIGPSCLFVLERRVD